MSYIMKKVSQEKKIFYKNVKKILHIIKKDTKVLKKHLYNIKKKTSSPA